MKHLGRFLLCLMALDLYAQGIDEEEWKENFKYLLEEPSLGFPTKIKSYNDGLKKSAHICPMTNNREIIIKDKNNGISIFLSAYDRVSYIDKDVKKEEVKIIQIYRGWDTKGSSIDNKTKLDIEGNIYISIEKLCSVQELS